MGLGYFDEDPIRLRAAALYVGARPRTATMADVLRSQEAEAKGGGNWQAAEDHEDDFADFVRERFGS